MTLTKAATLTKRIMIVSTIFIVLLLSSVIGYRIWYENIYLPSILNIPEIPTQAFGSLPDLDIQSTSNSAQYNYTLDTQDGKTPLTPPLLPVYFMPSNGVTLLAPERIERLATSLGFPNGPELLSSTLYKYTDSLGGSITIDLSTANFSFERPVSSESQPIPFSDNQTVINNFRNYLSSKNLLTNDLSQGPAFVNFNGPTAQTSQVAEISLLPSKINDYPIITPIPNKGLVNGLISNHSRESDRYFKLEYIYWPVDLTTSATYPLINSIQAFEILKSGNGYILKAGDKPNISITDIYLAYLQTRTYTPYLQPVFVFEGPDFLAIVPAISYERQSNEN